jgi:septal ring factor EnvC (AmiA/AmiB activator)
MRHAGIALLVAALAFAPPARADDEPSDAKLKAIEQRIDTTKKDSTALDRKARDLAAETARLQAKAVASAQLAQEFEARLTALDADLAKLAEDEVRQRSALDVRQAHEREVLAALERLTVTPPAAFAFAPGSAIDTARGAMLMGAAVPALASEAAALADGLDQLDRTRDEIARRTLEVSARQAALDAERRQVEETVRQRQALEGETRAQAAGAQQKLATLVAEAGDLKELLQRIERERAAEAKARNDSETVEIQRAAVAPPAAAAAASGPLDAHRPHALEPGKTRFQTPAAGRIVKRWGDPEGFSTSKGLTIATRQNAQIVAPYDGRIEFAGPFKGYGQILIIDHGGGYHSLLAGMDRIDSVVGQWVVTGEPLGTMQPDGKPSLYLELRRQGQPINPLPWLAARDDKASG